MANTKTPDNVLSAAVELTRDGARVVPIPIGQKGCFLKGWQNLRLDEADLEAHFSKPSNLGVLLGAPSAGLVDVDLDHELCKAFTVWLPHTDRIHGRSSNPGSHYWYVIEGTLPGTTQLKAPSGEMIIELRSTGSQTVVPPSIYFNQAGAADALQWVSKGVPGRATSDVLGAAVHKIAAATLLAQHWPATGSRHDASLALAGALLRHGWAEDDAADFIERVASAAGDEEALQRAANVRTTASRLQSEEMVKGLPSLKKIMNDQVVTTIAEWLKLDHRAGEPAEWGEPVLYSQPQLPDLPANLLPSPYREFADALAQSTEVPEALCVMTILAIVATACTKKFVVSPQSDWPEPVNIYTLVALPPANNKSQVLSRCLKPLVFWEMKQETQITPLRLQAISAKKNHESRIESLRRKLGKAVDVNALALLKTDIRNEEQQLESLVIPVIPKLFVNDITPESLATKLEEQGERLAVISDEGGFFENIAGLYTNGKANNDVVLKGFDGGHVRIDRRDRAISIRPFLTIAIIAQPQVLKNIGARAALQGKGIPERFLYCTPASKLGKRTLQGGPVSPAVEAGYINAVTSLLNAGMLSVENGIPAPTVLTLSDTAHAAWSRWRQEIEPMLGPNGELVPCQGWGGKLGGYTLRLAGLLELMAQGPSSREIGLPAMTSAISLARLLIPHALAAYDYMGANPAQELASRIILKLREFGSLTVGKSELYRALRGGCPDVKRLNEALQLLEEREVLRPVDVETKPGKRKRRVFEINPAVLKC